MKHEATEEVTSLMRMRRGKGQSLAEYAVLIGLVLGAVLTMQHYIRLRIVTAIKTQADQYANDAQATGTAAVAPLLDKRTSTSLSNLDMNMASATSGNVKAISTGTSYINGLE